MNDRAIGSAGDPNACRITAHSTLGFAALGDHSRLPWRFFARLVAADSSGLGR
jgi:hypothetical protein